VHANAWIKPQFHQASRPAFWRWDRVQKNTGPRFCLNRHAARQGWPGRASATGIRLRVRGRDNPRFHSLTLV